MRELVFAGLNDAQRQAALAPRRPVAILAGAGTGKTTTITNRIACQVRSGAFDASRILAVTFTDKAAGELKRRLLALGVEGGRPASQPMFRRRVLAACRTQCALCRLRHGELLDTGHIKEDSEGGEPVVPNGVGVRNCDHALDLRIHGGVTETSQRLFGCREPSVLWGALFRSPRSPASLQIP